MEQKQSKKIGIILGLILVAGGIYGVFFVEWKKEKVEEPSPIRPLKMIKIGESVSYPIRKYPGKVTALKRVRLAFQVDGYLIERPILKGQQVKKGQLLARVDPRDFQNRFDSAQAELEQTSTQLERIEKAIQGGAVSQTDMTNARAVFKRAEAKFKIAQKALEDTKLLAPFDALIADIFVDRFQNVRAKQEIVSLQKIGDILIEVSVPQERILLAEKLRGEIGKDKPGFVAVFDSLQGNDKPRFVVVFDSLPGQEFDVKVYEYTTEADPLTQTYLVTFLMPSPEGIYVFPGMTATIWEYPKEIDPEDMVLLAPIDAVPVDGIGQYYIWKAEKKSADEYTVHRHNVEVGAMEGDSIRIISGLSRSDKIAASGVHLLREGQKVREFIPKLKEAGK
ncbi:MAG: efflux RND transporter periplasmic adaptor subunit [Planctomycetota bacterium]|jgi:RND family efflux transporter MFP subunit